MSRKKKKSSQAAAAITAALQIAQEHAQIIAANTPAPNDAGATASEKAAA